MLEVDVMADIYYLDYFNQVGTRTGGDNVDNRTNTMRLYTTNNVSGTLKDLVLVAPYITPPSFTGTNSWEGAGDNLFAVIQKAWAKGNENIQKLGKDVTRTVNGVREVAAHAASKVGLKKAGKWLNEHPVDSSSFEMKSLAAVDYQKTFAGSSTTIPTDITASYLSDPTGFKWYTRRALGKKPLKNICYDLYTLLVGQFDDPRTDKGGMGMNLISHAPNHYACNTQSWKGHLQGSLTLCIGENIVVKELLPETLTIVPSLLETTDGDYYGVMITVNLTAGRLLLPNEVADWIKGGTGG